MPRLPTGKLAILAVAAAVAPHVWTALKKGFRDLGRKVIKEAEEPGSPPPREADIPAEKTSSPMGQEEIDAQREAVKADKQEPPA
ncbi:MAG: hypothetical protein WAO58_00495 [Fimbriimonadaceae bacterium]